MKEQERKKRKNSMQQPEEVASLSFINSAAAANAAAAVATSDTATTTIAANGLYSSSWPRQAAERVRLLVPDEYKTPQEKQQKAKEQEPMYCHLHYHVARHVLLVVMKKSNSSSNEMMILDVIHPNDLIGADISLELNTAATCTAATAMDDTSPPRTSNHSSSRNSNDNNNNIDKDDDNNNSSTKEENDEDDDINIHHHNRRATNEPPSETLYDHRGHAILTLYVYPRINPTTCTWLNRLGITSYTPPPLPRQSMTAFLKEEEEGRQQQHDKQQTAGQPRFAHFRKFQLAPAEDLSGSSTLLAAIRQLAKPKATATYANEYESSNNNNNNQNKYLIIVNPKSGPKKNAAKICETIVQPMLQQSGIVETKLVITTHPRHAQELMMRGFCANKDKSNNNNNNNNNNSSSAVAATVTKKEDKNHNDDNDDDDDDNINLLDYTGIILMGGDGIIHEVLNGIMQRPDAHDVLQKITFGIVGCGSCNGLAATIAHASHEKAIAGNGNLVNQVFLIAKGYQGVRMDISRYQTTTGATKSLTTSSTAASDSSSSSSSSPRYYYSFLTFTYGLIADIDIESELLHWLGEIRIDIWAVWRVIFSLRRYRARFSYLPPGPSGTDTTTPALLPPDGNLLPASVTDPLPTISGNNDNKNNNDEKYGWKTLSSNDDDDDNNGIILFWASQVSHAAENTHQAPDSRLQDGLFKIMLIRDSKTITRWQVARILLALASGTHVDLDGVEFIDCIAYRLEPLGDNSNKGLNVLDGEVIQSGPIQAQVLPSMVRIFCNSPASLDSS